jgi:hypothetical protein
MILCTVIPCSLLRRHKRIGKTLSTRVQRQCSKDGDFGRTAYNQTAWYLIPHTCIINITSCQNIKSCRTVEGEKIESWERQSWREDSWQKSRKSEIRIIR